MNFREDEVPRFLEIFSSVNGKIRSLEGCKHLELKQDLNHPSRLATISHWVSEDDLNNYRKSDFFNETWQKTKALFKEDAKAFSLVDLK